jgi:hypothetical protein
MCGQGWNRKVRNGKFDNYCGKLHYLKHWNKRVTVSDYDEAYAMWTDQFNIREFDFQK